ncbi:MAG: tetratricopeptide repeat protein [Leptolyngbyaceae cyanobacterium RM2_2_21]|nr:tetratricopeptide repeat protein [Leptolyngbyaceae cyanobacterium RM2_2_21]
MLSTVRPETGPGGLSLLNQGLAASRPKLSIETETGTDPMTLYELHYHAGIACRHLQDLNGAVAHYQQAIAQPVLAKLELGAYLNLGAVYMVQRQPDVAADYFRQAIAIDPSFAIAHYNLGIAYRTQGLWLLRAGRRGLSTGDRAAVSLR